VSFSLHDENAENIINRVSSYSRQVPQISNIVDFDPSLKDSLSTEATSIINDDEEDSLGLECEPFRGVPSESEGTNNYFCSSGSTLAVAGSAGEAEQIGQANSTHFGDKSHSTRRSIRWKPTRRTLPVNTHSYRSEKEENETSLLMIDAASCLEAQQKTRKESKRTQKLYKMINRYQ